MFAQRLIISQLAKILPGGGEIISHPDSLTNTNHSALNTRRIGFVNVSGRPWSLRANVSAASMWLEPAKGAKKAHFGRVSGVGIVCAFKQRKITLCDENTQRRSPALAL